jgi:hypothetical protein
MGTVVLCRNFSSEAFAFRSNKRDTRRRAAIVPKAKQVSGLERAEWGGVATERFAFQVTPTEFETYLEMTACRAQSR